MRITLRLCMGIWTSVICLEGCLTVLVTSLSVLTTEGWMMVAHQGTAATGGLNEDFREVFSVSARIDSVSHKSHK